MRALLLLTVLAALARNQRDERACTFSDVRNICERSRI